MPRKRKEVQEEEEEGVTRCVCGQQELPAYASKQRGVDPSLFIQCEQCEVWQHGFCVGLRARDVPDVYYCEGCRPEFHDVRTRNGHTTSKYVPTTHQSSGSEEHEEEPSPQDRRKRRQTMNSREDDILQRVLEQSAREAELLKQENDSSEAEAGDVSREEQEQGDDEAEAEAEEFKPKPEEQEPQQEPPQKEPEEEPEEEEPVPEPEPEPEPEKVQTPPPPKRKRRAPARNGPRVTKGSGGSANGKKCKPKIPSPRVTLPEMRKRVSMILEFSGHTQTEMDTEDKFRENMLQEQRQRKNTGPIMTQLEDLYSQHKKNISQLEGLTSKLLAWQEKYG